MSLSVALGPPGERAALEALWLDLETRAEPSFFQSWGWLGCWLDHIDSEPLLLTVSEAGDEGGSEGGRPIGLGLFCQRDIRRRGVIRSRALFLQETGEPRFDSLTIERNGLLAERGREAAVVAAALKHLDGSLRAGRWDEVFLSGVPPLYAEEAARQGIGLAPLKDTLCHLIDLEAIRAAGGDYVAQLGKKTRQHLRRTLRHYEASGPLLVTPAESAEEAVAFLEELVALHLADWAGRGRATSLSDPWFVAFHRDLVRRRFDQGEIQLLRLTAGAHLIGLLYHFTHRGRVVSYQWGLVPEADPKVNYGLAADALAAIYNLEAGQSLVDFLHGDSLHKRRLGTTSDRQLWIALQRRRPLFRLENLLRRLKRQWESGRESRHSAVTETES